MPKSTKKKKDKAADFSKAKLKLGKGKQIASNAVDTTFKARSIALPTQSISKSDSSAPSTRRRLSFDDLLTHLKHYNPGTRKEALFGLKELFEEFPDLMVPSLTPLLNGCVRVIGDEDASVRKALLAFFGWLFARVSTEDLVPHASVLVLFTTSAQTHIFPEIRIDAVRFLDLLLEHMPSTVVDGWARPSGAHGRRVLEGYLGILNAGTTFGESGDMDPMRATSTASVVLSPASKLVVLKSLATFISTALRPPRSASSSNASSTQQPASSWFFASSFSSKAAFRSFDRLVEPTQSGLETLQDVRRWTNPFHPEAATDNFVNDSSWAFDQIESHTALRDIMELHVMGDAEPSSGPTSETAYIGQLARALQPTLISTFLDYAPAVFSPNSVPPETDLQLVLSSVEIARILYGHISNDSDTITRDTSSLLDYMSKLLGHMSIYFPFMLHWPQNSKRDIKTEDAFQSLNLAFCELSSLLMLGHSGGPRVQELTQTAGKNIAVEKIKSLHVGRVRDYVLGALRGETCVTSTTQPALSRSITPSAYSALLPTLWALITIVEPTHPGADGEVLDALVDHSMKASSNSALKRHTIGFLGRIALLKASADPHRLPQVLNKPQYQKKMREWLSQLPKTLWELGSNDPSTTESILRLLLRLSQRQAGLLDTETLSSLRSRLVPYFVIRHATRGRLPGPYTKLSLALRFLALDVVFVVFAMAAPGELEELNEAVLEVAGDQEKSYWTSLLATNCK